MRIIPANSTLILTRSVIIWVKMVINRVKYQTNNFNNNLVPLAHHKIPGIINKCQNPAFFTWPVTIGISGAGWQEQGGGGVCGKVITQKKEKKWMN